MNAASDEVMDLIFGRWRSQILSAGTELGLFDHLDKRRAKTAETLAAELDADPTLLYRLLRAQAAIGLLEEDRSRGFVLTDKGDLLCSAHPQSLKSMARLEEGPQHYALWKHLPAMVRDGKQNAFVREFGRMAFDYALENRDYAERFKQAMTSYSAVQSSLVLEALHGYDFSGIRTLCDVAGGYGHLMCALLLANPGLRGIVLDLPEVVEDVGELWATKLGLQQRCQYIAGDMFEAVPNADAYSLKMILHDWNDGECIKILSNIRKAATGLARVFVVEHVVPSHNAPHFSKLFDIHMMCWGTGQASVLGTSCGLMHRSKQVAVGTRVTSRPPHRTCSFPAYGSHLRCDTANRLSVHA
jgi:O-methyltransferase domain/Dimerisation domain